MRRGMAAESRLTASILLHWLSTFWRLVYRVPYAG